MAKEPMHVPGPESIEGRCKRSGAKLAREGASPGATNPTRGTGSGF